MRFLFLYFARREQTGYQNLLANLMIKALLQSCNIDIKTALITESGHSKFSLRLSEQASYPIVSAVVLSLLSARIHAHKKIVFCIKRLPAKLQVIITDIQCLQYGFCY